MRKFYLQNAAGERFGLNKENGVFFSDPSGLGFEQAVTWGDLGRGFFTALDEPEERADPQTPVTGKLTFLPPAYANYRSFSDWIHAAGNLVLIYQPYGTDEFEKPVEVGYLQKGELNKVRWLQCPVAFEPSSPWRRPTPTEMEMQSSETGTNRRYPYRYPIRYGTDAAGRMSARIRAAGHLNGAVLLRYTGAIVGPEIRLTGAVTGKVYGICRLSSTLGSSDTLELSTMVEDCHVHRIAPSGTAEDLSPDLDLSQNPYFRVPCDEDSILSIESSQRFTGAAQLTVYHYYRTV